MSQNYYEKYLKYKMKYLQIQNELNLLIGGKCETIQDFKYLIETQDIHAISFHDPLGDGLISGDKDDNVAMMFEALVFGPRLTIVIVDGNTEGTSLLDRFNNPSLQPFFTELKKHKCTILNGNDRIILDETKMPKIAFICAPINDDISNILNRTESITDIYMQGDIPNGVNYKNSFTLAKQHIESKYNGRLTMLSTAHTRISFNFDLIDIGAYHRFRYYNELQRHVLAQLLALPDVTLPYAVGLIISTADIQKVKGFEKITTSFGTLYNNACNMISLLATQGVDVSNYNPELISPIRQYINGLLRNKFPTMNDSEIEPLYLEIFNRLIKIAIIATALLIDPTQIIDKSINSIRTFQTLPPLELKDESIQFANETPALYDFIAVSVGLQYSLNKRISPIHNRAEETEQPSKSPRTIEPIVPIEDVLSNKARVMPLCIGLFNEIINTF